MTKVRIIDGNGSWHFTSRGYVLDVAVDPRDGYHVYQRDDADCMPVAHKVNHLLGKQVVASPRKYGQISEEELLEALEAAA
ncbi:hypothetical protein [Labrys neptuniae]